MEPAVGRRYGKALFQSARKRGEAEVVGGELKSLEELFRTEPRIQRYLHAPTVSESEKVEFVRRHFGPRLRPLTVEFLALLIEKRRAGELETVAVAYDALLQAERNVVQGRVVSARPVEPELVEGVRQRLARLTGKQVELRAEVDPSLLGGMAVYLGGKVIDGSVRTRLERVRDALHAVRVH